MLKLKTQKTRNFSRFLNLNEFLLFEEIGNFRGFRVFDFGLFTEIENLENSEIFSGLLNLSKFILFEKIWEFRRFSSFRFWPLCWNRKLGKLESFYTACTCFVGESSKFPRFPSFRFYSLCWNRKHGILGIFFKTCKVKGICFVLRKL